MGTYLRNFGFVFAMFFMVFSLYSFIVYYTDSRSMKQDTYKEILYSAINQSTIRLHGAEGLYEGSINDYYLDSSGSYSALEYQIVKQLGLNSKSASALEYEFIRNNMTGAYYIHITTDDVDTVMQITMEEGQ